MHSRSILRTGSICSYGGPDKDRGLENSGYDILDTSPLTSSRDNCS